MKRRDVLKAAAYSAAVPAVTAASTGRAEAVELMGHCILEQPSGDYSTTDVEVESHDGTSIAATVYEPPSGGPHPAVLMTHGWGLSRDMLKCSAAWYANNDYVVMTYDSRGFGESGGEVNLNGPKEQKDVSVLLDYLANHDNVMNDGPGNPKVGMDGGSYGGGIQLLAAARDDRIDAIVPRVTWHDLRSALAPGGVLKATWQGLLLGMGEISASLTGDSGESLDQRFLDWYFQSLETNEMPEGMLEAGKVRSPAYVMDQIDAPALVISGWSDTLFPPNEAVANYRGLRDRGVESRLMLYEGGHALEELGVGEKQRRYMDEAAMNWMERHVRGADAPDVAEVSVWAGDAEEWRTYDEYPPSSVSYDSVELSNVASGSYSIAEKRTWWSDEKATFDVPIDEDTEVLGSPELELYVEPQGPEARLYVKLYRVSGRDEEFIDDQRTAFRVDGEGMHKVDLDLVPLQEDFSAGDTLRIVVDPSDMLYLDSRTSDGTRIHHDDDAPSKVRVPTANGSISVEEEEDDDGGWGWW